MTPRGSTNDPAMHSGAEHVEGVPPEWARCVRCGYAIVGLRPDGVCPECGLGILASWPQWELRECHGAYIRHLFDELGALHGVASIVGLAALVGVGTTVLSVTVSGDPRMYVLAGGIASACILSGIALGQLFQLIKHLYKHANSNWTYGSSLRRCMKLGVIVIGVGEVVAFVLGLLAFVYASQVGSAVILIGAVLVFAGLGLIHLNGMLYAAFTLERAGDTRRRSTLTDLSWLLPFVGLIGFPFTVFGVLDWWWIAAVGLLGVAIAAATLARRCTCARGVLRSLMESLSH